MMNLMIKVCLGLSLTLAFANAAKADAILTVSPETLNPGNLTGSVVVQIASNAAAGSELIGAFDLNLQLSAFTGALAGQMVTITGITPNAAISFAPAPNISNPLAQNGTVQMIGAVLAPPPAGNNVLTSTPRDFFTINFSTPVPITTVDTFTVGFTGTSRDSIFNTNFQPIFGSAGSQLVAVPEPSSALLGIGLLGGVLLRRRRVA